jgi:ribulose-phosphate 3-epimerase
LPYRKISPSILSANFTQLGEEVEKIYQAGADLVHIDVMDGNFVPNLTIGMPVVSALKKVSPLRLDVHLMIEQPEKYIEEFVKAGSYYLTIHVESTQKVQDCLDRIRQLGVCPGITLKPGTPIEKIEPYLQTVDLVLVMTVEPGFGGQKFMDQQVDKIKYLQQYRNKNGLNYLIEVDGGINPETAQICWQAGADILVAGSAVFCGDSSIENYKKNIDSLRN